MGDGWQRRYIRRCLVGGWAGYLLVFDGRVQDYGLPLLKPRPEDGHTVVEQFVDVRPEVKPAGPAARA